MGQPALQVVPGGGRPAVPPGFVRRPRVADALNRGVRHPLTVVCAGAGYGKTLAVAAWASKTDQHIAWLVAGGASGLRSFWLGVVAAITDADGDSGNAALADLTPGVEFGSAELERILDALCELRADTVLVVDDFHTISDPEVIASISELLDRRPSTLRLVLITRTEPPLRLRRRQIAGDLVEIGADELAFTRPEVEEFCRRAGADVSSADIDVIVEKTAGWPAGLRLLLLSADRGDLHEGLRRFGGKQRLVAAYLLEEVLDHIAPSDRKFLLATSIADPINANLARALTGRADSGTVLDGLVAINALTVQLTDREGWYSYHPLLRELLRSRLDAENPDIAAPLHRKAAAWFVGAGDPIEGLRHLGLAADWDQMLTVLATVAVPLILSPHAPALVAAMSPATVQNSRGPTVATLLIAAVAEFQRGDFAAMHQNAMAAKEFADEGLPARLIIALCEMVHARISRLAELVDRGAAVATIVRSVPSSELPSAAGLLLIAENARGIGLMHRGDLEAASQILAVCRDRAAGAGISLMAIAASAYLTIIDVIHGALPAVGRQVGEVLATVDRRGWSREPQVTALYAAAALMHLERNELKLAEAAVERGCRGSRTQSDAGARVLLEIAAVRIAVVRGDVFAAREARVRLTAVCAAAGALPDLLRRWSHVAMTDVDLMEGAATDSVLVEPPEGDDYAAALERTLLAQFYLRTGHPEEVFRVLGNAARFAPYRVIAAKAAVLGAVAAHMLRRDSDALVRIGEAIALAEPVGAVRPFIVGGPSVPKLLERYHVVGERNQRFVEHVLEQLADGPRRPIEDDESADNHLTERELAVLRYLPTMYKAAEIAADLFVSVNTVKTHQQSIYRKLGVSTRRAAVERARERNLL
ncbi:LuxR C-terminal-related transcriptional regulator [Gordonia sp. NPDC003422]